MKLVSVEDFHRAAQKRLPRFIFEYIEGGGYDEVTLRHNVEDFRSQQIRQYVLRDVAAPKLNTHVLGRDWAMPVGLSPLGIGGFYRRRGETQVVRAARDAGIPFILSTMACCPVEEVHATGAPFWVQLYMIKDRGFLKALIERIQAAGIDTLFLTVDLPVNAIRYRDRRSGLHGQQNLKAMTLRLFDILSHPAWAWDVGVMGRPMVMGNVAPAMPRGAGLAQFQSWVGKNFDPSVTYKDIDWLRQHWKGKLVLKGILEAKDAVTAAEAGMDGIVVSNHGGRQLDGARSTITALPYIRDAVAGRMALLLDCGIRSGLDVLKARALGADAVLLGRAWAWALAAGGQAGVAQMLAIIREELEVAMQLSGQQDINALDSDLAIARGSFAS